MCKYNKDKERNSSTVISITDNEISLFSYITIEMMDARSHYCVVPHLKVQSTVGTTHKRQGEY